MCRTPLVWLVLVCASLMIGFGGSVTFADEYNKDRFEEMERANEDAWEAAEEAREAAEDAREAMNEACEDREHGGGGALGVQTVWLDMEPFQNLISKEPHLQDKDFDVQEERATLMLGLLGHHESPTGFRGGMAFWLGYKRLTSDVYPVDQDTATHDSVTILRIIPAYGGFNFDKVFSYYNTSFSVGSMMGGGAYVLHTRSYDKKLAETFVPVDNRDTTENVELGAWAVAPFVAWELRGGVTTSLAPFLHVGLEGLVLMTYAPEGFGIATGDFFTASPGVRLKLIFGKVV